MNECPTKNMIVSEIAPSSICYPSGKVFMPNQIPKPRKMQGKAGVTQKINEPAFHGKN
jgi:hypothetical protein